MAGTDDPDRSGEDVAEAESPDGEERQRRRTFMANSLMGGGLLVSHLMAAGMGLRYLQPVKNDRKRKVFIGVRSEIAPGAAFSYETPTGQTVNVVNGTHGFIALSDVCPHLGCRVHWDSSAGEFLCPCHDGHFDRTGKPVSGPPADMGAGLSEYKVIEDGDLLFLELEMKT